MIVARRRCYHNNGVPPVFSFVYAAVFTRYEVLRISYQHVSCHTALRVYRTNNKAGSPHLLRNGDVQRRNNIGPCLRATVRRRGGPEHEPPVCPRAHSRVQPLVSGRYKGETGRDAAVAISVPRRPVGVLTYHAQLDFIQTRMGGKTISETNTDGAKKGTSCFIVALNGDVIKRTSDIAASLCRHVFYNRAIQQQ